MFPSHDQGVEYLNKQVFEDITASVVKDGKIKYSDLNEFLKNKAALNVLENQLGEEGVQFLKNLETYSNRIEKNIKLIEGRIDKASAKEREILNKAISGLGKQKLEDFKRLNESQQKRSLLYKLDDFFQSFGLKGKAGVTLMGIATLGAAKAIPSAVAYELFMKIARSKTIQNSIKKAASQNVKGTKEFLTALESLKDELD